MDTLSSALGGAYRLLSTDMSLFGFTFSYWDVFIWGILVTVVGCMIVRFLWN